MFAWICWLGLMTSTMSLNAQFSGSNAKTYSLKNCIEIALENNPDIRLVRQQLDISKAGKKQATGSYLPSATFSMGYSRDLNPEESRTANINGQIIGVSGSEPNSYNMSVGLGYTIFDGFARAASYDQAEIGMESSKLNIKANEDYVNYNVRRLFVEVIRLQESLKLQEENHKLGLAEFEAIKAKFDAGTVHEGVVASQEADLANREFNIVTAENNLNIAKANLLEFMGLSPAEEADFINSDLPNNFTADEIRNFQLKYAELEKAVSQALEKRADIQADKLAIKSGESALRSAKSGYYPNISASLGWSWSNTKFSDFSDLGRSYLGLNLSIPLFDQFRTNYSIESAKYQIMQSEAELFKMEQSVRTAIRSAFLNLASARKQLEISERALAASQKNFDITKERFNIGSSNITDYLSANNSLVTSQLNRVSAVYTYYIAERELEYQVADLK